MSTSCSPAPEVRPKVEIQSFLYAEVEARNEAVGTQAYSAAGKDECSSDAMLAQREAAVREAGRREGESSERALSEAHLSKIRESLAAALLEFARERARYFQQVEGEVVQLGLGIARKILHREAQIDPLLLAGMVRVALEKMEIATQVTVRVHAEQVSECRSYFAQHMEARNVPEVAEDPGVALDQCVLQTALGTTELGVGPQLKEIEQGLLDLLAKRPANP